MTEDDAGTVDTGTLSWRLRLAKRRIYMEAVYLRSVLRSRIDPRPVVHVTGDSHVGIFLKNKPFVVHWFGPATAYNLKSPSSTTGSGRRLFRVLRHVVREKDKVLLVFGEIDCRVHINNQHVKSGGRLSLQDVVNDTVASYVEVLDRVDSMNIDFYVASVPPAAREENIFGVPNYPPIQPRCAINRMFNESLRDCCAEHGYTFLDVYSRVVDSEGLIRSEYSCDDGTHLRPEAVRFFRQGLGIDEEGPA